MVSGRQRGQPLAGGLILAFMFHKRDEALLSDLTLVLWATCASLASIHAISFGHSFIQLIFKHLLGTRHHAKP